MDTSERRRSRRYQMRLRVESGAGEGWTHDASAGGLFFVLPERLEAGEEITLTLVLPQDAEREQRLRCRAKVIRTTPADGDVGVAAQITDWAFDEDDLSS